MFSVIPASEKMPKILRQLDHGTVDVQVTRHGPPSIVFTQRLGISRAISTVDIMQSKCKYCLVRRTLIRMYRDVIQMCERRIEALED